jgi:heme ABC exporter ATP-binding subunit CcmA
MLSAVNLTKTFGNRKVLRGLSLNIAPGEIVSLIGVNGAGKTTLLRILSDLTRPDLGIVQFNNMRTQNDPSAYRRQIGVVLHAPMLYANLTARENLRFFSRLYKLPRADERVEDLLHLVNLHSRADDLVRVYSRGMQQRLSIARALLHDPACLLLDEPYTGLDQDSAEVFEALIHQASSASKIVLLATHDLDKACRASTRIDLLHLGRIVHSQPRANLTPDGLTQLYREVTGMQPVKHAEGDSG